LKALKKLDRRGVANILVQMLIALLIVPIVFLVGGFVLQQIVNAFPTGDMPSQAQTTLYYIQQVWNYWPIIAVIVIIIWAIAASQRREPWYDIEE
jgi:hypothetical protein